jgi:hypothetical protein
MPGLLGHDVVGALHEGFVDHAINWESWRKDPANPVTPRTALSIAVIKVFTSRPVR